MKRFLSILLSVAMVMSMMPMAFAESVSENGVDFAAETVETAVEAVQGTETELADDTAEVSYSTDGGSTWTTAAFDTVWSETAKSANWGKSYQIKVLKDFSLTADKEYSLSYGVKVTIYADADVTITVPTTTKITVSSDGQYNKGDAILTFGKSGATGTVTFDGGKETFSDAVFRTNWSSGSYMGHLVINDGVSIKNFKRTKGGTYYGIIYNNGQLDINGGLITDNEISSSTVDSVIFNCRKLNIAGGEISNNSITSNDGYIVMVRGSSAEFTMTGGKIILNNVRKTVIQLAQDDSSYQGSATITEGTIANNKAYSSSDDDFTAEAKDISIGASLTKPALNGTAEIGTIETSTKNITNSKFITIASGFAPATPISVLVARSYIGSQVYPSEGMQVATVEDGASINGKLVYYNTDFSISDDGTLAGPPEAEYSYSYYNSTEGFVTETKKGSFQDAVTAIKNSSNAGTIKILADSIELKQTASFPYETTITSDHDVTFTKGFTGGPMFELPSAGSKKLVSFTANAGYNITIKGANDGDNPVFSMPTSPTGRKLDLTNVTIQDNTVSGNGGAIRLTNNAGVKLTNVTIQNCSAGGFGGAVYHEDCGNNVGGVYCENVTFNNNKAKGGSAIYVDGVTGMSTDKYKGLTINGCTFTGNSSTNETASTAAEAVKLDNVIYVDCISGSFNQSVAAELKNTNTFTGNTTYSDINLGSNMATMSNLNKSISLTDFSLSTDREGGKLKVVVGSYSVGGTAGTYVFYASGLAPDQLKTMAENFSLTADKSGSGTALGNKAILPHSTYSNTLTVKEPVPQQVTFKLNSDRISAANIADGTVTYNQDNYANTLPQGSFSMSSVGGVTHAVTATPGHTITFTANLNTGYQVKSFTVTGASGSAVSVTKVNDTTYTFVMPNEEVTVDATVRKSSSITVVQPESGSITVTVPDMTMVDDKFTAVEDGTTVTLSATGDDFGKWSIVRNSDSKDITTQLMASNAATSKNTSFTMPAYDITITAKVNHGITVNADGGTYMVVKSTNTSTAITKAVVGDKIWVDLTPNTNYKLTGVEIKDAGGETVSYRTYYNKAWHSDASLLESGCMVYFNMPDKAVTINVTFTLDACAITTDIKNGTISGITSPAAIGSDVSFTLAPTDDTYKLDSYKVFKTGDEATTVVATENNGTYTFTMPSYPVTVSATFVKKTHAVTVEIQGETAGGAVSINKTSPVTVGEEVQVTVDTNAHYVLASLTMNDTNIMSSKSFTMPNKAVTIKAAFEKTKHDLAIVYSPEKGEIQGIAPNNTLPWGTVLHFTVTPNQYYVIDYVAASINGVLTIIKPDSEGKYTYTYTTTPADTRIIARYKKQQFTVKANETQNGTIKLISTSPIDWGKDFTINVKADPNYEIDTVTVDGETVSVNNLGDYTFVMPTRDVTVSATFKKIKYTITGEGNNVTFGIPDKSTYNWGDTVKITATPDKWYNIKNVYAKTGTTEITKVSGKENTYSFAMPARDITIVAAAERPNFTVTFDSQGGSDIIPATVANGAALTKPAAPSWAGRGFAGWYTDADCTQKYDFTKHVTGDLTLYARWFLWGDVNGDGKVNSNDALLIQRCRVGLTDYSYIKNKFAGLVSQLGDGTKYPVSRDALLIQRYRVGLITRFTVEDTAAGYEFDLEHEIIISPNA